ncbi:MAG: septal ring lytic transglycosylase RlpA family protein [Alphaproteobacteria bacterium]|nr:septal ring lytic transglycosylase RlpA family protein [Alphaproteobacteria bacterium]
MGVADSNRLLRVARGMGVAAGCLALAGCAASNLIEHVDPKYGVTSSAKVVDTADPIPKGGGTYRVGKPYVVAGRTYVPEENPNYRVEGLASWYGDDFHGRLTANGEVFDMGSISAAHTTLPMPSYARVTNLGNGRSVIVRINDRGPYHGDRVIDVSHKTAELLDFKNHGVARVRVEYVGRAPLEGSDDRQLMATLRTGTPAPAPSMVRIAASRPFLPEAPKRIGVLPTRNRLADDNISRGRQAGEVRDSGSTTSHGGDTRQAVRPVSAFAPVDSRPADPAVGHGLY